MTSVTFRVDEETKQQSEILFDELGLNMSSAINMFLKQAIREQAIPFKVSKNKPNALTMKTINEAMNGINLNGPYDSVDSLMEALNAED